MDSEIPECVCRHKTYDHYRRGNGWGACMMGIGPDRCPCPRYRQRMTGGELLVWLGVICLAAMVVAYLSLAMKGRLPPGPVPVHPEVEQWSPLNFDGGFSVG